MAKEIHNDTKRIKLSSDELTEIFEPECLTVPDNIPGRVIIDDLPVHIT